jgi:hypothetical protein
MELMRFDVFGKLVLVTPTAAGWAVFYPGVEGKMRPAEDIFIPAGIKKAEIAQYLADLCHEWASAAHPQVRRLD